MTAETASASVSSGPLGRESMTDLIDSWVLVTAIANYTVRVQETSLSSTQRQEALKFIGEESSFILQTHIRLTQIVHLQTMYVLQNHRRDNFAERDLFAVPW